MLTESQITLQEALQDLGITKLPKELPYANREVLIEGIALVTKIHGIRCYVKVAGDGNGNISIKKDYGSATAIRSIDKIYATQTMDVKRFRPDLRSNKDIKTFLVKAGYGEQFVDKLLSKEGKDKEQIKLDRKTVNEYINKVAAKVAQETLDEEKRIDKIRSYANRIKNEKKEY